MVAIVRIRVGSVRHCLFWKDRWCGDFALENTFLHLCAITSALTTLVSQFFEAQLSEDTWVLSFRRNLRLEEINQLEKLQSLYHKFGPQDPSESEATYMEDLAWALA